MIKYIIIIIIIIVLGIINHIAINKLKQKTRKEILDKFYKEGHLSKEDYENELKKKN